MACWRSPDHFCRVSPRILLSFCRTPRVSNSGPLPCSSLHIALVLTHHVAGHRATTLDMDSPSAKRDWYKLFRFADSRMRLEALCMNLNITIVTAKPPLAKLDPNSGCNNGRTRPYFCKMCRCSGESSRNITFPFKTVALQLFNWHVQAQKHATWRECLLSNLVHCKTPKTHFVDPYQNPHNAHGTARLR